jgi:hypothetical protein
MVSAFGATGKFLCKQDMPSLLSFSLVKDTSPTLTDPVATAQLLANVVKAYDFDGIDVDYEDMTAAGQQQSEPWLESKFNLLLSLN